MRDHAIAAINLLCTSRLATAKFVMELPKQVQSVGAVISDSESQLSQFELLQSSRFESPWIGFSYDPLPPMPGGSAFALSDATVSALRGQWRQDGRDDLGVMSRMGANVLRVHRNNPIESSEDFLTEADIVGLKVVVGISDYGQLPYDGACWEGGGDCFSAAKAHHHRSLETGGFSFGTGYHRGLAAVVIADVPEISHPGNDAYAHSGSRAPAGPPSRYTRNVLSAFDGIIAAEVEHGFDIMSGVPLAAVSAYEPCEGCPSFLNLRDAGFGCCIRCSDEESSEAPLCADFGQLAATLRCSGPPAATDYCPALAAIMDIQAAFADPSSVGYEFRTSGWQEAFQSRFLHAVKTAVLFPDFERDFLDKYRMLPFNSAREPADMVPVFVDAYFAEASLLREPVELQSSLALWADAARTEGPFLGFFLFEFQVAYWRSCDVRAWDAWTRVAAHDPEAVLDPPVGCRQRAHGLFALGDVIVSSSVLLGADVPAVAINCLKPLVSGEPEAVARSFGGQAPDTSICEAGWDAQVSRYCVATRSSDSLVAAATEHLCSELEGRGVDCTFGKPEACEDTFAVGDFVFSRWFRMTELWSGEATCGFNGAGVVTALPGRLDCVLAGSASTTLTTTSKTTHLSTSTATSTTAAITTTSSSASMTQTTAATTTTLASSTSSSVQATTSSPSTQPANSSVRTTPAPQFVLNIRLVCDVDSPAFIDDPLVLQPMVNALTGLLDGASLGTIRITSIMPRGANTTDLSGRRLRNSSHTFASWAVIVNFRADLPNHSLCERVEGSFEALSPEDITLEIANRLRARHLPYQITVTNAVAKLAIAGLDDRPVATTQHSTSTLVVFAVVVLTVLLICPACGFLAVLIAAERRNRRLEEFDKIQFDGSEAEDLWLDGVNGTMSSSLAISSMNWARSTEFSSFATEFSSFSPRDTLSPMSRKDSNLFFLSTPSQRRADQSVRSALGLRGSVDGVEMTPTSFGQPPALMRGRAPSFAPPRHWA